MSNLTNFSAATNNELFDAEWKGGEWMVEHVETQETLAQFEESSHQWASRTSLQRGEIAGLPFIAWSNAQARKGDTRQAMSVIDLGDVRIALPGTDLTIF